MKLKGTLHQKILLCVVIVIVFVGIVFFMRSTSFDLLNQFKSFSYTIDNQSDYHIVSVETGINTSNGSGELIEGTSKEMFKKIIKSGTNVKITPSDLTLSGKDLSGKDLSGKNFSGAGSIYLKYTDSRGESFQKTICGYTESLNGYTKVTITNDKITVKENCM